MRDALIVAQPRALKPEAGWVQAAEQAGPAAEQDVDEVEPRLVQEGCADALLDERAQPARIRIG